MTGSLNVPRINSWTNSQHGDTAFLPNCPVQISFNTSVKEQCLYCKWHVSRSSLYHSYWEWYRVIKKFLCTWWLQYRKLQVVFRVSPASLQTFIDTRKCVLEDRVQYSTVTVDYWNCLKYCIFGCFCTVIVRWTETFWSPCINECIGDSYKDVSENLLSSVVCSVVRCNFIPSTSCMYIINLLKPNDIY